MNAAEWNARYPVGTPVVAYPGIRPEHPVAVAFRKRADEGRMFGHEDPCTRLVTRTRTPAWELGHGDPVVSVDGYAGGILLEHVDPLPDEGPRQTDPACGWNPVQATTDCDWDRNCPVHGRDAKVSRVCGTCGWRTSVWHVDDGSAEVELNGHVVRAHGGQLVGGAS